MFLQCQANVITQNIWLFDPSSEKTQYVNSKQVQSEMLDFSMCTTSFGVLSPNLVLLSHPAYSSLYTKFIVHMPLCPGAVLSVRSLIALHCALVSVWPTSSSASVQRGPVGPRKRPPHQPASLLHWGISQSVSSQYHSVSAPAGQPSSESQHRLSIHPPRAHTLEVRLGGWRGRCQYWPLIRFHSFTHYLTLALFLSVSLSEFPSPQAGGPGRLEREEEREGVEEH